MPRAGDYRMYVLCGLAIVNSATNGYDGSMMNGLQTLPYWVDCKCCIHSCCMQSEWYVLIIAIGI
jgi:hypothetical protein